MPKEQVQERGEEQAGSLLRCQGLGGLEEIKMLRGRRTSILLTTI